MARPQLIIASVVVEGRSTSEVNRSGSLPLSSWAQLSGEGSVVRVLSASTGRTIPMLE